MKGRRGEIGSEEPKWRVGPLSLWGNGKKARGIKGEERRSLVCGPGHLLLVALFLVLQAGVGDRVSPGRPGGGREQGGGREDDADKGCQ